MIVTELYKGQGLGNQLACYVTTRVMALDKGYKFGIKNPQNFKGLEFLDIDFGEKVLGGKGPEGGPPTELPQGIKHYYTERKIFHPNGSDISIYDKDLVNVLDDTKIDGLMQGEEYIEHRKEEIKKWLEVKKEYECYEYADENTCVINFRGGEYARHPEFFLEKSYWDNAISHMRKINPNFRFIVITDDTLTAKKFFPDFGVFHFSIGKDYSIIKNAHYLILSNSTFAFFPAWLSDNLKYCIAPKYFARHNISDGYWSLGTNITKCFTYQNKEGKLFTYEECMSEFEEYKKNNQELYPDLKIQENFLVISNYQNDIRWVAEYTDNYLIYNKDPNQEIPKNIDAKKIIQSPNIGYNIYDYFTFIIDNYENLPLNTIFTKGNIFPRHVSKDFFTKIMNNKYFTPIEDYSTFNPRFPVAMFSSDGGYCELNTSWYLKHWKSKYFKSYNQFLDFVYKKHPKNIYIRFAPGGNYIVPRENILKVPKIVYENLREIISYTQLPGEAHTLERFLYTLWNSNFEFNPTILQKIKINEYSMNTNIKEKIKKKTPLWIKNLVKSTINEYKFMLNKILQPIDLIKEKNRQKNWLSKQAIQEYRKNIKIYDCFNFFNELELLEIRLNILDPYVDYFVLVESPLTHSGKPKELFYEKNKEKFKKFEHKIIHYIIPNPIKDFNEARERLLKEKTSKEEKDIIQKALNSDNIKEGEDSFLRDFYEKESVKIPLKNLQDNDFCYVSDLDEIWNPEISLDYSRDDIFRYKQIPYIYYLNNRSNEDWAGWTGTIGTKYKNIKNDCLNHLRTKSKLKGIIIKDGGWHFSFQGGAERVKTKIESYSHQEINTVETKSKIKENLNNYRDVKGRFIRFWNDENDLPKYLKENKEKYIKMFRN